jgi:hypothetical protein
VAKPMPSEFPTANPFKLTNNSPSFNALFYDSQPYLPPSSSSEPAFR